MNYVVISDKNNIERRALVATELKKVQLEPRFVDAVMGKHMTAEELKRSVLGGGDWLLPGEIGCALSHLKVYKSLLESPKNSVLILEDDIQFASTMTYSLLEELYTFVDEQQEPTVLCLYDNAAHLGKVIKSFDGFSLYEAVKVVCTHAYIINRAAAKKILAIQSPLRWPMDLFEYYYKLNCCRLYCVSPALITQKVVESTIGNRSNETIDTQEKHWQRNFKDAWNSLSLLDKLGAWKRKFYREIKRVTQS